MGAREIRFAEAFDGGPKHVVTSSPDAFDWNAERIEGDLEQAVRCLKQQPGDGLWVGGVALPRALADLGLVDEFAFLVHPVVAGHGPTLLAGLGARMRLELVERREFRSGIVALRYRPVTAASRGRVKTA